MRYSARPHSSRPASRTCAVVALPVFLALTLLFLLAGCGAFSGGVEESAVIPPASAEASPDAEDDFGLGPGVRPLSFGPGDKSSPRVSPTGEKVAFVLDGRAAEKTLYAEDLRLRTAGNLEAEGVEWLPDGELAILGAKQKDDSPGSLFVARPKEASTAGSGPDVREIAGSSGAAAGSAPGSRSVIATVPAPPDPDSPEEPAADRLLVLLRGEEEGLMQILLGRIKGRATGLSVAPDGRGAALAVETGLDGAGVPRFEVQTIPFSGEASRRVARAPEGEVVLGAPQWTQRGVYFVAGEAPAGGTDRGDRGRDGDPGSYALYRAEEDSDAPFEPVRGVGEDFVASSISASPDGDRLAVVGRRNPGSPTELYILDLASDTLEAATTNENMEIKTNPRDLAWSPDGSSVIIVARGAPSDPEAYDAGGQVPPSAFYNLYEVPVGDPNDNPKED